MSATVEESSEASKFTSSSLGAPSPFGYSEKRACPEPRPDVKVNDEANYRHAPWLLRRTSIHVESAPLNIIEDKLSDQASISTTKSDEKRAVRNLLSKFGRQKSIEQGHEDCSSIAESNETNAFGTTVSIEAAQPRRVPMKQREMKGLEQAASVKRWAGSGKPAEAWGKLNKDPELWNPQGDTYVYFGYSRPHASFRIQSSILKDTQSDQLMSKLQDGYQRVSRLQSPPPELPDVQKLSLDHTPQHEAPSTANSSRSETDHTDHPIRYEIHFPPPTEGSKTTILRYHITTRNLFAFLTKKPLVGLTFYQALVDLHQRLHLYMPQSTDCTRLLIDYLTESNHQNVSNDPAAAAGLLAWSEEAEVQWRDGWREGFVHCCGMYTRLVTIPEYADISHTSRTLLERSHLELEARIADAERRLSSFDFDDMWSGTEIQLHPSRLVFDQFRRFLQQHYAKANNKHWPPHSTNREVGGVWLTSSIVFQLQRDFAALYEYHVDRGVVWERRRDIGATYRNFTRQVDHQLVEAKGTEICLAELFSRFDEKHKSSHIPHPFPLLPNKTTINNETKQVKTSFFSSKSRALEKRIIFAFSEASNATLLGPEITLNGLTEAFLRFEKSDDIGNVDPQNARRARWILLYGVLQVLSTLSVDTPDLFFSEGVSYFLNPRLKGTPPWGKVKSGDYEEASPKLSYCWVAPEQSWGQNS